MRFGSLKAGCAALGLTTLTLVGSPAAQADDASFVRDAKALGFVHASPSLISTAESACYFLGRNRAPAEVEERIVRYTRISPPNLAHDFLVLATNEYCPQYAAQIG